MANEGQSPKRRPIGVWVICAIYVLAVGATLMAAQQAYVASSLTGLDWMFTLAIGVVLLSAAVSLFLLRRIAVALFSAALVLSLALTAFQVFRRIEGAGRGALYGWVLLVAVIVYARRLAKRGVLS
jgi:hypothetical protein